MEERLTRKWIREFVKEQTGQDQVVGLLRPFIHMTGNHLQALILNQIIFWSERTTDPDGWFYKTAEEWDDELCLTYDKLIRAVDRLSVFGVERCVRKVKQDGKARQDDPPKTHYRINKEKFLAAFFEYFNFQEIRNSRNSKLEKSKALNSRNSNRMEIRETRIPYKEAKITTKSTYKEGSASETPPEGAPELLPEIAEVCAIDLRLATPRQAQELTEAVTKLEAIGATPDAIRAVGRYWYTDDWRGRQGTAPRPAQLCEVWGQAARASPVSHPRRYGAPKLTPEEAADMTFDRKPKLRQVN